MKYMSAICVLTALAAIIQTSGMIGANFNNSRIWDENQRMIENYSGGDLVFKDVYDESVFRGAIPEDGNFNTYYLREFGIDENVRAYIGYKYYRIADEHGRIVSEEAVKKRDIIYMPLADAANYIGAKLRWYCSAAEMTYGGETLRFREYTYSAMTARFGGRSKKLKYPVRNLSSTTYISLCDINALFNLKLSE